MSSILVVDDEAAMREFYRRALAAGGYRPIDVRTAEEALDFLAMTPEIQVVVVDLTMPGKGGAWLIEQMRERFQSVAVILATADERVPGNLSLLPSVVNYLVKPISAEQLLNAVRDAVEKKSTESVTSATSTGADPIESWLDQKLTHRKANADDRSK
jgi:DNA-binding NtrC family response regulator